MVSSTQFSVETLLEKCEHLVNEFEYESALPICDRILQQDPDCLQAMLLKATILVDTDHVSEARSILQSAIQTSSDQGYEHYFALAQLSTGFEALGLYRHALDNCPESDTKTRASILSAMAELYMTDLCMESNAESECESYIQQAVDADPNNYDVLMTWANMLVSQCRWEDAKLRMKQSLDAWIHMDFESEEYPSYEFRLCSARLLVELENYDLALPILEMITTEDDSIIEPWYLLALVLYQLKQTTMIEEGDSCKDAEIDTALSRAEQLLLESESDSSSDLADAISELRQAFGQLEE